MNHGSDSILDDLFQGCAFAAFLEQARCDGGWPDPERTRRRAYAYYETALAERQQCVARRLLIPDEKAGG